MHFIALVFAYLPSPCPCTCTLDRPIVLITIIAPCKHKRNIRAFCYYKVIAALIVLCYFYTTLSMKDNVVLAIVRHQ